MTSDVRELCVVESANLKISISYKLQVIHDETQIHYFLNSLNSTIENMSDFTNLSSIYKSNLIQIQAAIISKHPMTTIRLEKNLEKLVTSSASSFRNNFNLLQSFKKRKIITHFNNRPIALTTINIFGDIKTIVANDGLTINLLYFHTINVKFSEFLIACNLKSFIGKLTKFAEIITILSGIGIGLSFFYNLQNTNLLSEILRSELPILTNSSIFGFDSHILWNVLFGFIIPNVMTLVFRKLIGRKLLSFALDRAINKILN